MNKDLHIQSNPQTTIEAAWQSQDTFFIDVRSPKEYASGHIPGAISIPLLENKEQESIGVLYKKFGQQKAIEKGYEYLDKKLQRFYRQFQDLPRDKSLIVYCARGGMRSQVVSSLLNHFSYNTYQLIGGYKAFRNWNLAEFDRVKIKFPIVLHGKTGVGKTLVLNRLENSLDLEGLAAHRGSLFGGIGKIPVTQKTFEANLLVELNRLDLSKPVFIEGESRKIGDVSIPHQIFSQMKSARSILLESSMTNRVSRTIEEYIDRQPDSIGEIKDTIKMLVVELGHKVVDDLVLKIDNRQYAECFEYILLNYYDRKYNHSMKQLHFEATVSTDDLDQAVEKLNNYAEKLVPIF